MKSVLAAIVALATVSAVPFVLDKHLVDGQGGHDKLAVFHHVSASHGHGHNGHLLRFVHLMPKVSYLGEFAEGFGSQHGGSAVKTHAFLRVGEGEKLVELLGLSDCKKWHVSLLGVWSPHTGVLVHRAHTGVKGETAKAATLEELVDFVHLHLHGSDGAKVFHDLFKKGLSSHLLTHKLYAKMLDSLKLHVPDFRV